MQNPQDVQLAAATVGGRFSSFFSPSSPPLAGIILGTGLSGLAATLLAGGAEMLRFDDIPAFPKGTVKSHEGFFLAGALAGRPVLVQAGRCHLYEGFSPAQVCMGVRVMGLLGVRTIVITNAAGALNPLFEVGGVMCMADMINHTGVSALTGENCEMWGERFPDMSQPFDPFLRELACRKAIELGKALMCGVYIGVHGPEMETPAETRMYRQWGADAVGMSTVLEVCAARHMGMKVLGLSCLTNKNLPDCMEPAPLEAVIRQAAMAGKFLETLIPAILAEL